MKEIYNETIHQDKKLANHSAEKFGSDTLNYQYKHTSFNIFLDQNKGKGPPGSLDFSGQTINCSCHTTDFIIKKNN